MALGAKAVEDPEALTGGMNGRMHRNRTSFSRVF